MFKKKNLSLRFGLEALNLGFAGIISKFSALLITIPQCVLGGATIFEKSPVVLATLVEVLLN